MNQALSPSTLASTASANTNSSDTLSSDAATTRNGAAGTGAPMRAARVAAKTRRAPWVATSAMRSFTDLTGEVSVRLRVWPHRCAARRAGVSARRRCTHERRLKCRRAGVGNAGPSGIGHSRVIRGPWAADEVKSLGLAGLGGLRDFALLV